MLPRILLSLGCWSLLSSIGQPAEPVVLQGRVTIHCATDQPAVVSAVEVLSRDFGWVLGQPAEIRDAESPDLIVQIQADGRPPEAWQIDARSRPIRISGADSLGAVYGVYKFSQQVLGVDPYWYWKDRQPPLRERLAVEPQVIVSRPATFRYRGWFVNDEDLLTEWRDGGGQRYIDYPYYHQVTHPELIECVLESLLRAGGNLVIPASFVDVMNEPEAELVRQAVRRGLYVTQHHIEPLGVSHFGFENYWKARGQNHEFAYGTHPDQVREVWRTFARRWRELAGDQVVWQLGLRGKADRAIWASDSSVSRDEAGRLISRAIAEQWEIVREVDPRPTPPATTTLWAEGSQLMSEGSLSIPPGVTIVFSDKGSSQTMQADFLQTPRDEGRTDGVYYHLAYWSRGPHLVQGTRPDKVHRVLSEVVQRGDTQYAILNVSNVREHVLGVQAATEILADHGRWSSDDFLRRFAPPPLHDGYRALLASFVDLGGDELLQDGTCTVVAGSVMSMIRSGKRCPDAKNLVEKLGRAVEQLDAVVAAYPSESLTPEERVFYDVHLRTQAEMLRGTYAWLRHLIAACKSREPEELDRAAEALEQVLQVRQAAEQGKWSGWYRGDKKVNVRQWLQRTRELRAALE